MDKRRIECDRICRETVLVVFRGGEVRSRQRNPDKAEFSYAIAVMDRIGGWDEQKGEQRELCGSKIRSEHVVPHDKLLCAMSKNS